MAGQPLERRVGEPGKESSSFPNAELGAKLININRRFISVSPQGIAKPVGEEINLGSIHGLSGWREPENEVSWYIFHNNFKVKASTFPFGDRFFIVSPTANALRRVRVERLAVNETNQHTQWEEIAPEDSHLPSRYSPEKAGEVPPTITLHEIIKVITKGAIKGKDTVYFLYEATFTPRFGTQDNLQDCTVGVSYQPIEEPVVL